MLVTNGKLNKVIIARGKDIMGRFLRWWWVLRVLRMNYSAGRKYRVGALGERLVLGDVEY